MNKFEMPVMELVSFSAEDIIRTSKGGNQGANGFSIGNEYKKAGKVMMGETSTIVDSWKGAKPFNMES